MADDVEVAQARPRDGPKPSRTPIFTASSVLSGEVIASIVRRGSSMFVRDFQPEDRAGIIHLWKRCSLTRPWNNPSLDIDRKLNGQANWLLVGVVSEMIVASVMVGYDGHRGWINYLAVDPSYQRSGLGRELMLAAENRLLALGCPKVNLLIRDDNRDAIAFYEAIGFSRDPVVCYGKRLIPDTPPIDADGG